MKEFNDLGDEKMVQSETKAKKTRRNHSQLGPGFVAPDGGFGWFVCFAAGCSNVSKINLHVFKAR